MPPRDADPETASLAAGDAAAGLRDAVVAAARRLRAAGLVAATEGNLSLRAGDSLLITPSGRRKDEVTASELLLVPLVAPDGGDAASPAGLRPSSDVAIHRAIYSARQDVVAVAHAHLPASMGLTLAGEIPDPAALPETALFLGELPFLLFGQPGSSELAERIGAAFAPGIDQPPVAVLLERHGAVAVGSGAPAAAIDAAVDRLELVEVLCRTWRDALLIRAARATTASSGEP